MLSETVTQVDVGPLMELFVFIGGAYGTFRLSEPIWPMQLLVHKVPQAIHAVNTSLYTTLYKTSGLFGIILMGTRRLLLGTTAKVNFESQ